MFKGVNFIIEKEITISEEKANEVFTSGYSKTEEMLKDKDEIERLF